MANHDQQDASRHGSTTTPLVFDEVRWVVQIRHSLQDDDGAGNDAGAPELVRSCMM